MSIYCIIGALVLLNTAFLVDIMIGKKWVQKANFIFKADIDAFSVRSRVTILAIKDSLRDADLFLIDKISQKDKLAGDKKSADKSREGKDRHWTLREWADFWCQPGFESYLTLCQDWTMYWHCFVAFVILYVFGALIQWSGVYLMWSYIAKPRREMKNQYLWALMIGGLFPMVGGCAYLGTVWVFLASDPMFGGAENTMGKSGCFAIVICVMHLIVPVLIFCIFQGEMAEHEALSDIQENKAAYEREQQMLDPFYQAPKDQFGIDGGGNYGATEETLADVRAVSAGTAYQIGGIQAAPQAPPQQQYYAAQPQAYGQQYGQPY